jgi:hypothetical protein
MLRVLPVTDDHARLNKLRPELCDNIHHPADAANATPNSNPPMSPSKLEDRARSIPQGYHL